MTNNDEQRIRQFMQAHKHEIADNGFSRRVMRRLPTQAKVLSDVLTAICVVLCATLLYVFDGVNVILDSLHSFFQYQMWSLVSNNFNLSTLLPALAVLVYFGIHKACTVKE